MRRSLVGLVLAIMIGSACSGSSKEAAPVSSTASTPAAASETSSLADQTSAPESALDTERSVTAATNPSVSLGNTTSDAPRQHLAEEVKPGDYPGLADAMGPETIDIVVIASDLDGDGLDEVYAVGDDRSAFDSVGVFVAGFGDDSGFQTAFERRLLFVGGTAAEVIADLDEDGRSEILLLGYGTGTAAYLNYFVISPTRDGFVLLLERQDVPTGAVEITGDGLLERSRVGDTLFSWDGARLVGSAVVAIDPLPADALVVRYLVRENAVSFFVGTESYEDVAFVILRVGQIISLVPESDSGLLDDVQIIGPLLDFAGGRDRFRAVGEGSTEIRLVTYNFNDAYIDITVLAAE